MPGTQRSTSRTRRMVTSFGVGLALFLVLAAATAACMSDDNSNRGQGGGINVQVTARSGGDGEGATAVLATFTPVPPDFTPEAIQTRSAYQTAGALTATAQGAITATAPPATTFDPNIPTPTGSPTTLIIPPGAGFSTSAGIAPGAIGSYNWYDMRFNRGAEITAPYVILPDGGANWATSTQGRLEIGDSPYAVQSAEIKFYAFDGNVAIPTDQAGNPGDTPAFYPQQPPLRQFAIQGADVVFTPDVGPGRYLLNIRVNWSTPTGLNPLWTEYVFIVDVL